MGNPGHLHTGLHRANLASAPLRLLILLQTGRLS